MSAFTKIRDAVTKKLTTSTDSGKKKLVIWGLIGTLVLVSGALIVLAPKKKDTVKAATPLEATIMRPPNRSLDLELLNRQLNALKQERAGDQRTRELAESDLKKSLSEIEKKITEFGTKPPGITDDALEKAIRSRVDNKLTEMKNTGELRGGSPLGAALPTPGLNTALPGSNAGVSSVPLLPRDGGGSGFGDASASATPPVIKRSLRASTESSPVARSPGSAGREPSLVGGAGGAGNATNLDPSMVGSGSGSNIRFDGTSGGAVSALQNNALRSEAGSNADANASTRDLAEGLGKKKNDGVYLPLGAIISGVALTGFDAPTSQAAQKNPVPMLIRIKAEAILPNRFTADIRECFVIASGFGTLTTRRAKLRTNAVSCVRIDGKVVESQLAGYVVGPDGREGVEGTLVSKTGEMLANSITAGFLSAAATRLSGTTSIIPVTGAAGAASAGAGLLSSLGDSAEGSAMSGAGSAINQVAKIYADMAKEAWPVVEVLPGQPLTIVLTAGVNLRFGGK